MYFGGFDAVVIHSQKKITSIFNVYLKSINSKCSNLLTSSVRFNHVQAVSEKCRINQNFDVVKTNC
jgi:hypothetical protein